jgi:hypothetical protein
MTVRSLGSALLKLIGLWQCPGSLSCGSKVNATKDSVDAPRVCSKVLSCGNGRPTRLSDELGTSRSNAGAVPDLSDPSYGSQIK